MGPAWMKKPSGPGMWVCMADEETDMRDILLDLSQANIDAGAPFYTEAVFGPIPEMPRCQCGKYADKTGYCENCLGG